MEFDRLAFKVENQYIIEIDTPKELSDEDKEMFTEQLLLIDGISDVSWYTFQEYYATCSDKYEPYHYIQEIKKVFNKMKINENNS